MENFEFEITSRSYRIKVPDIRVIMNNDGFTEYTLNDQILSILGVHDSDYDGHFGHYVYVTIDDYDHGRIMDEISEIIMEHIERGALI